ncbi:bacteriocin-like protein [Chryseobacterium terrae]|uniref:Bacteriocin-type signal sequence-containing protein n=1 Tax=Chryseobacterium terrae TaxID=3163299 RepID=A0ABW8Y159_9FLAO
MKKLKKISRTTLKTINGGLMNQCNVDSDCPASLGQCPRCEEVRGKMACFYPNLCI